MALSFRTAVSPAACTSGTPLNTGGTVAVGDFAIAVLAAGSTLAHVLTACTAFSDAAGNTWTPLLGSNVTPIVCDNGSTTASMIVFTSVITNAASGNLTITATYASTSAVPSLFVDVITGFTGTATIDPGGATSTSTGTDTLAKTLTVNVLGSGTGAAAAEMCYAATAFGGNQGSSVAPTSTISGLVVQLQYSGPLTLASDYILSSAAPTSSSSITVNWSTSRAACAIGLTVYDKPSVSSSGLLSFF